MPDRQLVESQVTGSTLDTSDITECFHDLGAHPALMEKLFNDAMTSHNILAQCLNTQKGI